MRLAASKGGRSTVWWPRNTLCWKKCQALGLPYQMQRASPRRWPNPLQCLQPFQWHPAAYRQQAQLARPGPGQGGNLLKVLSCTKPVLQSRQLLSNPCSWLGWPDRSMWLSVVQYERSRDLQQMMTLATVYQQVQFHPLSTWKPAAETASIEMIKQRQSWWRHAQAWPGSESRSRELTCCD